MALGLNGSYGIRTEADPNRRVEKAAFPQSLASRLHYQEGRSSKDILTMDDATWEPLSKGGLIAREDVADYMRAYEHYQLPTT
jgi:hypothetical protein